MKILSFAVPCYNSENYMRKCVDSLLTGGEDVEIIIVNDGSKKDNTAEIADRLEAEHPGIVRAIHKENGGHGSAVNSGIEHATGMFFKVVDSDDWVNEEAYHQILDFLKKVVAEQQDLDLLISNYVYEKEGAKKKRVIRYPHALPTDRFFGWKDIKRFFVGQYILMHSAIYRTSLLRECGLKLPEHCFYVDNIYVYYPLPYVQTMYYMDVNFYRYYIGRADQSVNEQIMISRIDQQLRVNKMMFDCYDLTKIQNRKLRNYMYRYLEIISVISSVLLMREGSEEKLWMKQELWAYMKERNRKMYRKLRYFMFLGSAINTKGKAARKATLKVYEISQKIFGFN